MRLRGGGRMPKQRWCLQRISLIRAHTPRSKTIFCKGHTCRRAPRRAGPPRARAPARRIGQGPLAAGSARAIWARPLHPPPAGRGWVQYIHVYLYLSKYLYICINQSINLHIYIGPLAAGSPRAIWARPLHPPPVGRG